MKAGLKLELCTPLVGVRVSQRSNLSRLEKRSPAQACMQCGHAFASKRKEQIYCSRECSQIASRRPVEFSCFVCGATSTASPSIADKRATCGSKECKLFRHLDQRRRTARRLPDGRLISEAAKAEGISISTVYKNLEKSLEWNDKRNTPKGERMHNSVLTDAQVKRIKQEIVRISPRPYGLLAKLAKQYGIAHTTMHEIASGKTWGWINP